MGASGKWVKYLIGHKKQEKYENEKGGGKTKKWRPWKSSKGKRDDEETTCSSHDESYTTAVAAVVQAPPKDFKAVRQHWAAIRIQTAFRALLARRALKALKGIVRIQALVRGRQVRKQAAVTLKCMQALVRIQARVRARRVRMSIEGQAVQKLLDQTRSKAHQLKQAEEGWCDRKGTLEDVRSELHMRQKGAFKRERAFAYSAVQKQWRSTLGDSVQWTKKQEFDPNSPGWSWLERWMAAKPWETRLMEQPPSQVTPPPKNSTDSRVSKYSKSSSLEPCAVKVRKNNVSTRISARPPHHIGTLSSSSPSYDESSPSSSLCTPLSGLASESSTCSRPNYMNMTKSRKAKQITNRIQRQSMDEFQFLKLSGAYCDNTKSSPASDPSLNFSKPLYLPTRLDRN